MTSVDSNANTIEIYDPHVHFYTQDKDAVLDQSIEELKRVKATNSIEEYLDMMKDSIEYFNLHSKSKSDSFVLKGLAHVETIVGQYDDIEKFMVSLDETKYIEGLMSKVSNPISFAIVPYINLCDAPELVEKNILEHIQASSRLRGFRQVLSNNYPMVEYDLLKGMESFDSNFLNKITTFDKKQKNFVSNFGLLVKHDMSFELQCHHSQLANAYHLLKKYPELKVCLNHIGCLALAQYGSSEEDKQILATWKSSLELLSTLPNVFVKLSMLQHVAELKQPEDVGQQQKLLKSLLTTIIDVFKPSRCMFASNSPVDILANKFDYQQMIYNYSDIYLSDVSFEDKKLIFGQTAKLFYKL